MRLRHWPAILVVVVALISTGCYTKFYRPGMESAGETPYGTLYNRYDSTAIDTTLTEPDWQAQESYPDNYGWQYWGRPRGYNRWGFDFYNFSPDYYWSYYGFYDYYGRPWWYEPYWQPWYWGYGGSTGPAEPPSKREGGRRDHSSGGNVAQPPSGGGGGTTVAPSPPPPSTPAPDKGGSKGSDSGGSNKRDGKRGR